MKPKIVVLALIAILLACLLTAWTVGGRAPSRPLAGPHETAIPRPIDPTRPCLECEYVPGLYLTPVPIQTVFPGWPDEHQPPHS